MIVVIGIPSLRSEVDGIPASADGLPIRIAAAAAGTGARVQLIGKVGDDAAGDALLIDLARAGVGHAALMRDPANATPVVPSSAPAAGGDGHEVEPDDLLDAAGILVEPASPETITPSAAVAGGLALDADDLELGLRYLVEFSVVVATEPLDGRAAEVVADAAAYAGAHVVALVTAGSTVAPALLGATILEMPAADPDGVFAGFVAGYATSLDRGVEPARAFSEAAEAGGWEPALA